MSGIEMIRQKIADWLGTINTNTDWIMDNVLKGLYWEDENTIYYLYNIMDDVIFPIDMINADDRFRSVTIGKIIFIIMKHLKINKKLIYLMPYDDVFHQYDIPHCRILTINAPRRYYKRKYYKSDYIYNLLNSKTDNNRACMIYSLIQINHLYLELNDLSVTKYILKFATLRDLTELLNKKWFWNVNIECRDLVIKRINELTYNDETDIKL